MSLSRKMGGDFYLHPERSEAKSRGLRHAADPSAALRVTGFARQMVFCGSGGTATLPDGVVAAGAAVGGAPSWPTSGCLGAAGVVVVFLVFLAVVVADALVVVVLAGGCSPS